MAFSNSNAKRAVRAGQSIALAPSTRPLYVRLEELLVSGGDSRITLAKGLNKYGCAPFPQPDISVSSSSTASSISERAYARAGQSRLRLAGEAAMHGVGEAFESAVAASRAELKQILKLPRETGVVFAASGTDAQLSALFLVRSLRPGPMTVIIVGADQTGSGTAHTARGQHFDVRTAQDIAVTRGNAIPSLAENLQSVEIAFAGADGSLRTEEELDRLVCAAVQDAIAQGNKVLLQAMDASKLGWRGPSMNGLTDIAARWPGQVQIVVDACQLRCGRSRLGEYLDLGFMVLLTGSKFFTGPAFSGALLTPACLDVALGDIAAAPDGLDAYAGKFDWPAAWPLREGFSAMPNYGQWLRWEAALEEMGAYYAVPADFRRKVFARLSHNISRLLGEASYLTPLAPRPASGKHRDHETIFSFQLRRGGRPLSMAECTAVYRALNADIAALLPAVVSDAKWLLAARHCLIGQPVRFGADAAVLRVSVSARQIRECWRGDRATNDAAITAETECLAQTIGKIGLILEHFDSVTGHFADA